EWRRKRAAGVDQLQELLQRAKVGGAPQDDGVVEPGMIAEIRFEGDDEVEKVLLGSRELASLDDAVELDVYSLQSPLGSAINGKKVGETASYEAPNGKTITVEIVGAKPYGA